MTEFLRWVALGDSYTIGTAVAAAERWPDQLERRLAAGLAHDPPSTTLRLVANLAVDGSASADVLRDQLPRLEAEPAPGFVSVLVGVNDVVRGVLRRHLSRHRRADPRRAPPPGGGRSCPGRRDAGLHRHADGARLRRPRCPPGGDRRGERAPRRGVRERGIAYRRRDRRDLARTRPADPALVAADGLHPSGAQYRRWVVERIEPAVRSLPCVSQTGYSVTFSGVPSFADRS